MQCRKIETNSAEETFALGEQIGRQAKPGDVYTLTGDLGVGKTVFTQGLAKGLGIEESINSPTFTIVQIYEEGRLPLYHFDVYRIGDVEEMEEIGFEGSLSLETHIPNSVPDGAEREAAENKLFLDAKRLARR